MYSLAWCIQRWPGVDNNHNNHNNYNHNYNSNDDDDDDDDADEPTSGLDASTSYDIVTTLQSIAKINVNVVTILHQPRYVCVYAHVYMYLYLHTIMYIYYFYFTIYC